MARKSASNQKSLIPIEGFENFDLAFSGILGVPKEDVEAEQRKNETKNTRGKAQRKN